MPGYSETYADQPFDQYLIIVRNASNSPVSTADCNFIQNIKFGKTLPFKVLMDPTNSFGSHAGIGSSPNDNRLLLGEGGVILYKSHFGSLVTLKNQIEGALGL
jgi:hypothetical protein